MFNFWLTSNSGNSGNRHNWVIQQQNKVNKWKSILSKSTAWNKNTCYLINSTNIFELHSVQQFLILELTVFYLYASWSWKNVLNGYLSKQIQHTKQTHVIKNCAVLQTKASTITVYTEQIEIYNCEFNSFNRWIRKASNILLFSKTKTNVWMCVRICVSVRLSLYCINSIGKRVKWVKINTNYYL